MSAAPKLLFLSGSVRRDSVNVKLAHAALERARSFNVDARYVDLAEYPLPLYDGDLEEREGLPAHARSLKTLFREADGFLIACPEYNSSITPLLKNTIDWMSRREHADEPPLAAFKGKVAALAAASPSPNGGLRGLVPVRMLLGNIGVHVLPQQLAVKNAPEAFDSSGALVNDADRNGLEAVVQSFADTTTRLRSA